MLGEFNKTTGTESVKELYVTFQFSVNILILPLLAYAPSLTLIVISTSKVVLVYLSCSVFHLTE